MFCRFFVLLFVAFFTATLFGCGAEKEEIILGEEAVVEKWIDPTDIGEEYVVKDVVHGDTVFLSTTSKQYTIGEFDSIDFTERGVFITTYIVKPDPREPNLFIADEERFQEGTLSLKVRRL